MLNLNKDVLLALSVNASIVGSQQSHNILFDKAA